MVESQPRLVRLPEPTSPGGPAYPCHTEFVRAERLRQEPELPLDMPRYFPPSWTRDPAAELGR